MLQGSSSSMRGEWSWRRRFAGGAAHCGCITDRAVRVLPGVYQIRVVARRPAHRLSRSTTGTVTLLRNGITSDRESLLGALEALPNFSFPMAARKATVPVLSYAGG